MSKLFSKCHSNAMLALSKNADRTLHKSQVDEAFSSTQTKRVNDCKFRQFNSQPQITKRKSARNTAASTE